VPQASTFYPYITCLACRGIIDGYPDGTFRPGSNVTRGQIAKIISNSAGFTDPQSDQLFADVPQESTFFDFVGRLASRDVMQGYPCGGPGEACGPNNLPFFRPNNNATRAQIAKIASNTAQYNDIPDHQYFNDVLPGSTFYTVTYRLAVHNVMSGYPCGGAPGEPCTPSPGAYFRPNNNATRGQTSKIASLAFILGCNTTR